MAGRERLAPFGARPLDIARRGPPRTASSAQAPRGAVGSSEQLCPLISPFATPSLSVSTSLPCPTLTVPTPQSPIHTPHALQHPPPAPQPLCALESSRGGGVHGLGWGRVSQSGGHLENRLERPPDTTAPHHRRGCIGGVTPNSTLTPRTPTKRGPGAQCPHFSVGGGREGIYGRAAPRQTHTAVLQGALAAGGGGGTLDPSGLLPRP